MIVDDGLPAAFTSTINVPEGSDPVNIAVVAAALSALHTSNRFHGIVGDETKDHLRNHVHAIGAGGIGVHASLSGVLADVAGISCVVTPRQGDLILAFASFSVVKTGTNTSAQFRLRYSSASVAETTVLSANSFVPTNGAGTAVNLLGLIPVPVVGATGDVGEATTVKLQGTYGGTAGADVTDAWGIFAIALRGAY